MTGKEGRLHRPGILSLMLIQDHAGPMDMVMPIGIPAWIFSIKARFINCSSANTRVVCTRQSGCNTQEMCGGLILALKKRSRSIRPVLSALCR